MIPTLNSGKHLEEVIHAAYSCVPVSRIIAADGNSTDDTLGILHRFHADIYPDGGSLGSARQVLIDHASGPCFLMLDSDVVLEKGDWLQTVYSYLSEGAGAVVLQMPITAGPLQRFISFYENLGLSSKTSWFATMATFFYKPALEGIHIPKELDGSEDIYIMLWLLEHGQTFKVLRVPGVHYHSPNPAKGRWIGAGVRNLQKVVGWRKVFPLVLRNLVLYPFAVLCASLCLLDFSILKYGMSLWTQWAKGYISGEHDHALKANW